MRPIVFGIDISDRSIEIVSLLQKKDTLVVDRAGRREIPAGLIERGVIQDADALVKTLAGFFDVLFGPKRGKLMAGAMLPATTVYSKTFTMPAGLDREMLRKAVAIEAADVFPMPMTDAVDAMILAPRPAEAEGPQDVLYAVASKEAVKAYRNVLVRAGAQPLFLDAEDQALARGLGAARPAEPILVVDIGNRTTLLVLTDRSGMRMSASIPFGGGKLMAALEKKLKVTLQEGEKLLRTQGFDPAAGDSRTFFILQQPTEELIAEIRKTLAYVEKRYGSKVRGIILAGGISLSPGLVEYIASNFQGIAVGLGKPFHGIDAGQTDAGDRSRAVLYAAAYGLALRAMNPRGSPGMDFTPGKPESKSPLASAGKFFSAIFSPLSMVTKGKKSHPRKKKAEEPVVPVVPADLPPVETPEEQPSTETSAVEELPAAPPPVAPVSVMDMTPTEMVPPPAVPPAGGGSAPGGKPAAPEPAEEPDFGLGIGDILRGEDEIKTTKVDLDAQPSAPADDTGKLSIEDILNRGAAPPEKKKAIVPPVRTSRKPAGPPISLPPGTGKAIVLVLLVLFCFGVAAAGIYMFVKKNGMPKLPFGQQAANENAAPAPAPAPEPAATTPGEAPTSVSLTVVIGTTQKESTPTKPFLLSRVVETDVKTTETFTSTGTTTVAAGKACGTATIINTTPRSYTFVATTRLLSKDGVLFRMTSAANIPASGTVDVHVCADQPGPAGDIGPTTFTIPGLSPEQQKRITAKSTAPMTGGSGTAKAVTAADIASARQKLMDKLKKEALDNFAAMLADGEKLNTDLMTSKELSATFPTAGTAGATFTATLSLRFRVLLIPEKDLAPQLAAALTAALPSGMSATDFTLGAPLYTVQAYDTGAETAEVRVEAPVIKR